MTPKRIPPCRTDADTSPNKRSRQTDESAFNTNPPLPINTSPSPSAAETLQAQHDRSCGVDHNLKRWAKLVSASDRMSVFNAERWHANESVALISAFQKRSPMLHEMMTDYIRQLPSDPDLSIMARAVTGGALLRSLPNLSDRSRACASVFLQSQPKSEQVVAISSECRAAMSTFLSGNWVCMTKFGITMVQNAFQVSDPLIYSLDDPELKTVFGKGVGCLEKVIDLELGLGGRNGVSVEKYNNSIFKNCPPSDTTTLNHNLKRWVELVSASNRMGVFDAKKWHANESVALISALQKRSPMLLKMMTDYIQQLPSDPDLPKMVRAVSSACLQSRPKSEQVAVISSECRAAMSTFLSGEWLCVTKFGIMMVHNAFKASDPQTYKLDDQLLIDVSELGLGCLKRVLGFGFDS